MLCRILLKKGRGDQSILVSFFFICFFYFISFLVLIWSNPRYFNSSMILYTCLVALLLLHETFHLERLVLSLAVLRLKIWEISKLQVQNRCEGWTEIYIYRSINLQKLCLSLSSVLHGCESKRKDSWCPVDFSLGWTYPTCMLRIPEVISIKKIYHPSVRK